MPNEDFVYLGDHARLPYGPRPLEEIRRFAREIGAYLEQQDVKLILVACNAATSAALPQLQEELTVPVVGVITPEAHAAVQATRNRRVGLLATAATVEAGRYARARPRARRRHLLPPGRVPAARAADRGRRPVRRGDGARGARVRGAAAGGGSRHRDPRLHALSADPQDLRARVRPRRDARLLGGGDGPRGGRDARAQGRRERARSRGRLPLPHDRRPRGVPRARPPLPPAPGARGRARHRGDARGERRGKRRRAAERGRCGVREAATRGRRRSPTSCARSPSSPTSSRTRTARS